MQDNGKFSVHYFGRCTIHLMWLSFSSFFCLNCKNIKWLIDLLLWMSYPVSCFSSDMITIRYYLRVMTESGGTDTLDIYL